jgi:hypothetical protein
MVCGDQLTMPSQDRVRRDDASDLVEQASTERLALGGEASALIVGQAQPLLALEFAEDSILFEQVGDQPRLVTVDEARKRDEEQLQWEVGGRMCRLSAPERLA